MPINARLCIGMLLIVISLLGLARCATRISVYNESSCATENIIGYVWYPSPKFTELAAAPCTKVNGHEQYYIITPNLPEETQADRRTDWMWWFTQQNTDLSATGITSCAELNDQNAIIKGAYPNTCINYPDKGKTITAYSMTYCTYNVSLVADVAGGSSTCGTNQFPATPECVEQTGQLFFDKIVCIGSTIAVPVSSPIADAPLDVPVDVPVRAPTSVPMQNSTPTKEPMMQPTGQPTIQPTSQPITASPMTDQAPQSTPKSTFSNAVRTGVSIFAVICAFMMLVY